MACVAVLSLIRTLELEFLQPHPRPILQKMELIPSNKHLIQSIHQNIGFLMELFDKNRMDGVAAIKDLETKLGDMAFRLEGEIEFQIAHLYETEEEFGTPQGEDTDAEKSSRPSFKLGLILQQAMEDIDAVKEGLIHSLHQKLGFLISLLDDNRMDGVEALKDLETKLRDVAAFRFEDEKSSSRCFKLRHILQQAIAAIEKAVLKIKNEYKLQERKKTTALDDVHVLPRSKVDSSQPAPSASKSKMNGKDKEFEIIKEMLIQHSSTKREVVLIKGMGGIDKTTLARQIYRSEIDPLHHTLTRKHGVLHPNIIIRDKCS